MNVIILSFLYISNLIIQLLVIKLLNLNYGINNEIFITFSYGLLLPIFLMYFIWKKYYNNLNIVGLTCGFLDFIQMLLSIMSIKNLTMGEYLTYRTCAIFFTSIMSYFFLKKELFILQKIGIFLIFIACIILISFSNLESVIYSFLCLLSSFIYSVIGILIEKYVKTEEEKNKNFIWTKLISNIFIIILGITYQIKDNIIVDNFEKFNNTFLLILIMLLFSFSENIFYYNKLVLINKFDNKDSGSFFTGILDIIRRIITFCISLVIFNELYSNYIYISYAIMLIGCIITIIKKKNNHNNYQNFQEQIINQNNQV